MYSFGQAAGTGKKAVAVRQHMPGLSACCMRCCLTGGELCFCLLCCSLQDLLSFSESGLQPLLQPLPLEQGQACGADAICTHTGVSPCSHTHCMDHAISVQALMVGPAQIVPLTVLAVAECM